MNLFFEQLANGASTGILYALLALTLVFIFRATDIINFAQGEMAMISTYVGWSISRPLSFAWIPLLGLQRHITLLTWRPVILGASFSFGTGGDGTTRIGYCLILIAAVSLAFLFGALVERFLVRPSEGKNLLNTLIVTLGLFSLLNSFAVFEFGSVPKSYPTPFNGSALDFGLFRLGQHAFFALIVGSSLTAVIYIFFQHTKLGLGMRATALNPDASKLMGINTDHMLTLGWGLAAAIGCVAGMLVAPQVAGLSPTLMLSLLLYGFAAAVLGGLDSPLGAVIGGLVVGIIQSMVIQYMDPQYSDIIAFGLIVIILLIKPAGLFGTSMVRKA